MKTLVLALMAFGLFSATGCGDATTTTDRPATTDRNIAPADKGRDTPSGDPTPDPTLVDDPEDDPAKADKDTPDTDLPAGVQEKPADELPTTDEENTE